MNNEQQKWIKYWGATLSDVDRKPIEINTTPIPVNDSYFIDRVPEKHFQYLWFISKAKKEVKRIPIDICPVKKIGDFFHAKQKINEVNKVYPFWIPALMDREGRLYPPSKPNNIPFFIRDYLTPNPSNLPSISSIETVDLILKSFDFKADNWTEYWDKCELFFKRVTSHFFSDFNESDDKGIYVQLGKVRNLNGNILNLYNHLLKLSPSLPLFNTLTNLELPSKAELPSRYKASKNHLHVGQMNGVFPLSKSQREAFYAFTKIKKGEVLAVNGPPGTGKTTLLQSFVANLLVNSVLEQQEPYLIMASSTNNQAITNILDSFKNDSSDLFSNRWLPDIDSFGLYFSSTNSKKYLTCSSAFGDGFIKEYESKNIGDLKRFFLSKFNSQFSNQNTISEAKQVLLTKLRAIDFSKQINTAIKYEENSEILKDLGFTKIEELNNHINTLSKNIKILEVEKNKILQVEKTLQDTLENLSFWDKLFFFIPKIKAKKERKIKRAVIDLNIASDIILKENRLFEFIDNALIKNHSKADKIKVELTLLTEKKSIIINNTNNYNEQIKQWDAAYFEKLETLYEKTADEYKNLSPIEDCSVRLDISYRNYAFWLAVHYREAEYIELLEKKQESKDKYERSYDAYKQKLQRIARITPLFISTFHSLPKYATYFKDQDLPYFELFDYIIVDEAGQVSPDVALASFSLAKKALVVGDVQQIEPVWSATQKIDFHNLVLQNIISKGMIDSEIDRLKTTGLLCSNGNIMQVAQNSCNYEEDGLRGVMLKEHRRCLDDIISYSNRYIYKNKLLPKVGDYHNKNHDLPAMAYINIPSQSEKKGSSRINKKEALIIARWIVENTDKLEQAYDKTIDKILGVVTPYSTQAYEIKRDLKNINNKFSEITVGTVHSLQGSEREIILFSLVLSKGDSLRFVNSQYNMINVAISRAKHSFLVFGNIEILDFNKNGPLGNLKKWLLTSDKPELSNYLVYDQNGCFDEVVQRISSLSRHIEVLSKSLEKVRKNIYIFSPFISINAIESDNISAKIQYKVSRGVSVNVVTDSKLDVKNGVLKESSRKGRELLTKSGANVIVVNNVHNKTIIIDDEVLIEGSFNWLSAARNINSNYYRYEASIVLTGEIAKEKIKKTKHEIKSLFV